MESNPIITTAKCLRCHRSLRAARSIQAGYGRTCAGRIRAAALSSALRDFTAAQVEKARELLADQGLIWVRKGVWQAMSSDGAAKYLVAEHGCNCRGFLHYARCYHVAAARMVAAGRAA